jgi:hypothetical protein
MNRDIRFRVWDGKDMYAPGEAMIVFPEDGKLAVYYDWRGWENGTPIRDAVLMQFTGLCDVEGREVYEGDVVEWDREGDLETARGVVMWEPGAFFCEQADGDQYLLSAIGGVRVVGNMYEQVPA